MISDQIGDLKAAANGPGASFGPTQAEMDSAINTSLGRQASPGSPVSIRRGGSWEGYRKTAPAHLGGLESGYSNPQYHPNRTKSLIAPSARSSSRSAMSPITQINNMTSMTLRPGNNATNLLKKATKLSRLF